MNTGFTVVLEVELPWPSRALSPNNGHGHYMVKHRAKKAYRNTAYALSLQQRLMLVPEDAELRVAMEFRPPVVRNRDQDNLIAAMKSGLDGIARALRVNDNRFRLDEPRHGAVVPNGAVRVRVYIPAGAPAEPPAAPPPVPPGQYRGRRGSIQDDRSSD